MKKAPYDNKTPLDIARKNGMKRMAGFAEMTMVRFLTGGSSFLLYNVTMT